jgi:hypothetical protein
MSEKEVRVERNKLKAAERKDAWAATKTAVGAYAKNPCRATEIEVAAALDKVKTLSEAEGAEQARVGASKRTGKKPVAP